MPIDRVKYQFTPSQLDLFTDYINSDIDYDKYWGKSEDPNKSAEEYQLECEKKLIDSINRCPKEPIEAADRGTCFNVVVDALNGFYELGEVEITGYTEIDGRIGICTKLHDFKFIFDRDLCLSVAERYGNPLSQYFCSAPLNTAKGMVWLYGYIDEWSGDKIYDIKTTSDYQFGKYERKWQRYLYPYCVTETFKEANITEFEFTAVKLKDTTEKNPIIQGEIYPEIYTYIHEQSKLMLTDICERFIDWLEYRREFITDRKIFGGVNPAEYIGTPIDITLLA